MGGGGIGAGIPLALALTGLVRNRLYGVDPGDPVAIAGGALLLIAVGLLAAWIPARRAARIDPMTALRAE